MAVRRPLVLANGDVTELPSSDSLFGTREKLSAARTYYVRTDGNDSNTGLSNTAGGAFATIQKAIDAASAFDLGGNTVTIQIGNGTYTGNITCKPYDGDGQIVVQGNSTTPSNVVLTASSGGIVTVANTPTYYRFTGMRVQGANAIGFIASGVGCRFLLDNIEYGALFYGVFSYQGGFIELGATTIVGSMSIFANAVSQASVLFQPGITVTLSNSPSFSGQFIASDRMSYVSAYGVTFSGSATGSRYLVVNGGGIFVNGAGPNYLPGSSPGVVTYPGWYDVNLSDGASGRNRIVNGKCEVTNSSTSYSNQTIATGGVPVEMFVFIGSGSAAAQVTLSQQVDAPSGFRNSLRLAVTSAQPSTASGDSSGIQTRIEGYNVSDLIGQTFTLSFWVRSARVGTHSIGMYNSGFDRSYVAPYTVNAANTWEQKQIVVEGGLPGSGTWDFSNGLGLAIRWNTTCGTQYQTSSLNTWVNGLYLGSPGQVNCLDTVGNIFAVTGMQLRKGMAVPPFDHTPYYLDLIQCRRYYQEYWGTSNGAFSFVGRGSPGGGNGIFFGMTLPVEMRVPPTATIVGTFVTGNCGQPTINAVSKNFISMVGNAASAGDAYYASQSTGVGFTLNARLQ